MSGNGRVKDSGHTNDALPIEARQTVGRLRHGIERIGDDDQNALRRLCHDLETTSDMIL